MNAAIINPVTEPSAQEIRAGIRRAEQARRRAELARVRATDELRDWLRAAQAERDITMEEAAQLAGITRNRVYELLREGPGG